MARFVDLTIPPSGWDSELMYLVCTIHRAMQFAEGYADADPYKAVCDGYISSRISNFDPLVPTVKIVTYNRGTGPLDRWTICSIRGTESWQSWVGNLLTFSQGVDARVRGKIHAYFLDAAQRLWLQVGTGLKDVVGNGRCMFTGHSLGGALAVLMAWFLKADKPIAPAAVVTLGSPRIGNYAFANPRELQPCPIVRLENAFDPVCSVPTDPHMVLVDTGWGPLYLSYLEFQHVGRGYVIHQREGIRGSDDWAPGTIARTVEDSGARNALDVVFTHSNTEYTRRLRNTMSFQPQDQSTVNVPWLDNVNERISEISGDAWRPLA